MKSQKNRQLRKTKKILLLGERALHSFFMRRLLILFAVFTNLLVLDFVLEKDILPSDKKATSLRNSEIQTKKPEKENLKKWWAPENLSLYGPNIAKNLVDREYSKALAKKANHRGRRLNSKGNCLRAVRFNLWNVLTKLKNKSEFLDLNQVSCDEGNHPYKYRAGKSAEHFRRWATENPISLYQELSLADISHIPGLEIEEGFIFVYKNGQYGFHKNYGHIEVVTKTAPLTVCSDHCRVIRKYRKPDLVLAPIRNIANLYTFDGNSKLSSTERSI